MATSNLFTTWGDDNKQIVQGKAMRVTLTQIGEPIVTVVVPPEEEGSEPTVSCDTWYKQIANYTCTFQYVGMTRTAAENCANAMRTQFTRQKTVWYYGTEQTSGGGIKLGWVSTSQGTVLDSEIVVVHDEGQMYHVEVQASVTDESYTKTPTGSLPPWPACFNGI